MFEKTGFPERPHFLRRIGGILTDPVRYHLTRKTKVFHSRDHGTDIHKRTFHPKYFIAIIHVKIDPAIGKNACQYPACFFSLTLLLNIRFENLYHVLCLLSENYTLPLMPVMWHWCSSCHGIHFTKVLTFAFQMIALSKMKALSRKKVSIKSKLCC